MISALLLSLLALAPSPYRPLPGDSAATRKSSAPKDIGISDEDNIGCAADKGVARLPFARGQNFCTLDAYLAHLERQGAIDLPWWRQIRPGVYEQVKRMTATTREVATRAELSKRSKSALTTT